MIDYKRAKDLELRKEFFMGQKQRKSKKAREPWEVAIAEFDREQRRVNAKERTIKQISLNIEETLLTQTALDSQHFMIDGEDLMPYVYVKPQPEKAPRVLWKDPDKAEMGSYEHHVKMQPIRKKQMANPELRKKIGQTMEEYWDNPEIKKQRSAIMKEIWKDPMYRKHHEIGMDIAKAKTSKSVKELWQDPMYREKIIKASIAQWQDPVIREKYNMTIKRKRKIKCIRHINLLVQGT